MGLVGKVGVRVLEVSSAGSGGKTAGRRSLEEGRMEGAGSF